MSRAEEPLKWPSYFPPTNRLQRFFIGLRWLGPDLSFFRELREQQAGRDEGLMAAWTDLEEREIALEMGRCFRDWLGWPSACFLPGDHFQVIAYGPRFQSTKDLGFDGAARTIEKRLGRTLPPEFWEQRMDSQFKDVVTAVLGRPTSAAQQRA
jgi:hypothetical protein